MSKLKSKRVATGKGKSGCASVNGSAFRVGARWRLKGYGIRTITGMFRRKFFPDSKWERIFSFGTLSKGVGLQVGELTLRKCYKPYTPNNQAH